MARRKRRHEEHENHERWLISYADFITLLFAFFVVLYATSNRNEEKEREFQDSLRHYMKIFATTFGSGSSGGSSSPSSAFETSYSAKKDSHDHVLMEKTLQKIIEAKLTQKERDELVPEVKADAHGVRVVLSASGFFPDGSAKMRLPAMKALASFAEVLKRTPYHLLVEGHTDDRPVVGGQYESNWELAGARASAIVRFLAKAHGVDATKMAAISFADQRPLVPNDTEIHRAQNRRIEILISTDNESED
jgi:chemotaxis protein MotB